MCLSRTLELLVVAFVHTSPSLFVHFPSIGNCLSMLCGIHDFLQVAWLQTKAGSMVKTKAISAGLYMHVNSFASIV